MGAATGIYFAVGEVGGLPGPSVMGLLEGVNSSLGAGLLMLALITVVMLIPTALLRDPRRRDRPLPPDRCAARTSAAMSSEGRYLRGRAPTSLPRAQGKGRGGALSPEPRCVSRPLPRRAAAAGTAPGRRGDLLRPACRRGRGRVSWRAGGRTAPGPDAADNSSSMRRSRSGRPLQFGQAKSTLSTFSTMPSSAAESFGLERSRK